MEIPVEIKWIIEDDQSNGYILQLIETNEGTRRVLPVVIGAPEAHAIAMELQGVKPYRPFTHDLLVSMLDALDVEVTKILITELNNNTFYASIYFDNNRTGIESIDARPSDAIALAIRVAAPIYVNAEVMDIASFVLDQSEEVKAPKASKKPRRLNKDEKLDKLETDLHNAVSEENYELAAKLRDQINDIRNQN